MSGSQVPAAALHLTEAVQLSESAASGVVRKPNGDTIALGHDGDGNPKPGGVFDEHGRVPVYVIRPGLGRGRGRHLYEADMLAANAGKFAGWKMYVNHLSPEARKAQGGLPRDVRDLGGRLQESWWDPSVPADPARGHKQGAVVGMTRPVRFIRELIDDDPELTEASISATATGVRPTTYEGQRAWLVEGIEDRGSLDWVTEGGAGGRIAPLLEASYATPHDVELALVESLDPDELREYLRERPAASAPDPPEGGDVSDIKPEVIQEALASKPELLVEALTTALESDEGKAVVATLVEAQVSDERDLIEARAQARVDRAFQLAGLERDAHRLIGESKLPDSWRTGLIERFSLVENRPTDELDVHDDVDDDGKVTKSAKDKLTEAVNEAIKSDRRRLAEANPTRVRGSGAESLAEAASEDGEKDKDKKGPKPYWAQVLQEAGVEEPESIYVES